EPPDAASAAPPEDLLDALVASNRGEADWHRGDCEACGRLAVLESERPASPPQIGPERPPLPPTTGAEPEVLPSFIYTLSRIPGLRFSPRNSEVLAKVRDGIIEDAADWALHYQALLLDVQSGFDRLLCIPLMRGVRHYKYQVDTALKVLREMRGRAILAYEVEIVDEAHKLKSRATQNWKLIASMRNKYMLLLTATPVQNDLEELFSLVTLLRPGQLSSYGGFKDRFVRRGDRRTPSNPRELRRLLKEVMIRNRRSSVLVLPPRRVFSADIVLSRAERRLYEDVTDFVRDRYPAYGRRSTSVNKLSLIILQKELGSSTFAAAETLRKMKESPNFPLEDRLVLAELHERAAAVAENEKARRLRQLLG